MMAAPGLLIGATRSGEGKTMVSCAVMAALNARGSVVQPFKVGPDYIDPGFHLVASGRTSYNLDLWVSDKQGLSKAYAAASEGAEVSVVEGVMGLFDTSAGPVDTSSAAVAEALGLPVVLVIDAARMGQSAGAMARGFANHRPGLHLAGVVLNRVGSERHEGMLRSAMDEVDVQVLGCIPRESALSVPEKHLGLRPANTGSGPDRQVLAAIGERYLDIDAMLKAVSVGSLPSVHREAVGGKAGVRIGVLRDEAFCFYYQESFDALRKAGAELVFFSPISEAELPEDIGGLIMGGGFPERFAAELEANTGIRSAIRGEVGKGMPVYAECGGLLYLLETLEVEGRRYEMTGAIKGKGSLRPQRQALGYIAATVARDCLIAPAETVVRGHEFHWSDCVYDSADSPAFSRVTTSSDIDQGAAGYAVGNVMASYVHLQLGGVAGACERIVATCAGYLSGGPVDA